MAIMAYILNSVLNFFVVVTLIKAGTINDPKFYIGCAMAIFMGFMLRIVIEWNNGTITWKKSLIQAAMSVCICYIFTVMWIDLKYNIKLEYILFTCSCFSTFIVGVFEKTMKLGISGYAKILLKKVLAEDQKIKEEN